MASKARGLNVWAKEHKGEDYDLAHYNFEEGDVVTTMIKCAHGETITLTHDCSLPRPYSRNYVVQGTKGIYSEDRKGIFLDGISPVDENDWDHKWEDFEIYREKYEHPLWAKYSEDGIHANGHGGMDYLVISAFVESAMFDLEPPIDVYDTATWMAITCLSEQSVAMGSMPVPVPDFTNGKWIAREEPRRSIFCTEEVCTELFEDK